MTAPTVLRKGDRYHNAIASAEELFGKVVVRCGKAVALRAVFPASSPECLSEREQNVLVAEVLHGHSLRTETPAVLGHIWHRLKEAYDAYDPEGRTR